MGVFGKALDEKGGAINLKLMEFSKIVSVNITLHLEKLDMNDLNFLAFCVNIMLDYPKRLRVMVIRINYFFN